MHSPNVKLEIGFLEVGIVAALLGALELPENKSSAMKRKVNQCSTKPTVRLGRGGACGV
jgi:hypothetical protein